MAVSLLGRKCMQNAGKYEPIQKRLNPDRNVLKRRVGVSLISPSKSGQGVWASRKIVKR